MLAHSWVQGRKRGAGQTCKMAKIANIRGLKVRQSALPRSGVVLPSEAAGAGHPAPNFVQIRNPCSATAPHVPFRLLLRPTSSCSTPPAPLRNVQAYIQDIRNCSTKEQEKERVDKELGKIRKKYTSDKAMTGQ